MSSTLSLLPLPTRQGPHLEMLFFGRIIQLPVSVTQDHWESFMAGLHKAEEALQSGAIKKIPRGASAAHFTHMMKDILAAWYLAKEHGPFTPLLNLISHIRTFEAVSEVDRQGICRWTSPALEEAITLFQDKNEARQVTFDDALVEAYKIASIHVLSKADVEALPSLLRHRSVDSLRHLSPDMVLRILEGVAQFEAARHIPAAIARSFRRALEVLCPDLRLPLSGEGQLITLPAGPIIPRQWGLKPLAPAHKPAPARRPTPTPRRRGPGVKG